MHPKVANNCGLLGNSYHTKFQDQQCLWVFPSVPLFLNWSAASIWKSATSIGFLNTPTINVSLLHISQMLLLLFLLLTFIFCLTWGLWFCTASSWPGWHSWGAWGGCAPRGRGGGGWWRGSRRCSRCQRSSRTRPPLAPARLRRWCGRNLWHGRETIPLFCEFGAPHLET